MAGENTNHSPIDSELVAQAKSGDLAAFESLVCRHERHAYSLALRIVRHEHDAQDATQQGFLSAVEHLKDFREDSGFATWLMRVMTNAALKILRKRLGLNVVSIEEHAELQDEFDSVPHPDYIADWRESPSVLVERNDTLAIIETALGQLDENHRLVFLLRDVEGLSVLETAQTLGISENNVKVRLLRSRLRLREMLTEKFGDPSRQVKRDPNHAHANFPADRKKV